ncbi:MAG: selenium-dependent molybdenum cofactor biosynthesis protein YqeB [Bacillota bacterium]|nr:selenium-dependent molybdenum cofactor biosynthesis protein YqeB [Bacillota bacterium]
MQRAGFFVVILETDRPLAIRRHVALSEALYEDTWTVEDITARKAGSPADFPAIWAEGAVPVLADPKADLLKAVRPAVVVDAIIAKKNLGTVRDMARCGVVAMGPGFTAGEDADIVIETNRGHNLGRLLFTGAAAPDTGIPGDIKGYAEERVIHAPASGVLHVLTPIGAETKKGDPIALIGDTPVLATMDGIVRGMLKDGMEVPEGLKMADIDPRREEQQNCFTISDKSRNLGGAVLEAVLILLARCNESPHAHL